MDHCAGYAADDDPTYTALLTRSPFKPHARNPPSTPPPSRTRVSISKGPPSRRPPRMPMAQPPPPAQPPLAAAHGIRSLQHQDSIYQAFDGYPWTKDKTFLSGLSAILGSPPNSGAPQGSPQDMATHARIFYYAQRIGVRIDFAHYQAWLADHPDHHAPDVIPRDSLASPAQSSPQAEQPPPPQQQPVSALPWQQAAPKADLYVDRSDAPPGSAGEPSYPMGFAEMLKLLQEGKPVPGIRQIPNTIARDPSVKPVGTRTAPKKPWENDVAPSRSETDLPKALDADFPAIDVDAPVASSETPSSETPSSMAEKS